MTRVWLRPARLAAACARFAGTVRDSPGDDLSKSGACLPEGVAVRDQRWGTCYPAVGQLGEFIASLW